MIASVGVGGLALAVAACSGGTDTVQTAASAASPESSGPQSAAPQSSAAQGGAALAKTTDIPVGGGTIFQDQKVVVTQPTQGEFKAFSAVCTHKGCAVASVEDGTINCPCHGSKFAIADGAVANGPAEQPLPAKNITVQGDEITLA
jgi:Rieske Fe-S protein